MHPAGAGPAVGVGGGRMSYARTGPGEWPLSESEGTRAYGRLPHRFAPQLGPGTVGVTPAEIVGLLAEPDRLKVVAALALGCSQPAQIADATDLGARAVGRALARLAAGGLATGEPAGDWRLLTERLREAAVEAALEAALPSSPPELGPPHGDRARVLRSFLRDGRLVSVPAARSKRRVVLEHIVAVFEPGVRYPEAEVSATLAAFHPDYAALRRYLVDEELLSRAGGLYWRSGGPVDV